MSDLGGETVVPVLVSSQVEVMRGSGAPGGQRGETIKQVQELHQGLSPLQQQDLLRLAHDPQLGALGFKTVPGKLMFQDQITSNLGESNSSLNIFIERLGNTVKLIKKFINLIREES